MAADGVVPLRGDVGGHGPPRPWRMGRRALRAKNRGPGLQCPQGGAGRAPGRPLVYPLPSLATT